MGLGSIGLRLGTRAQQLLAVLRRLALEARGHRVLAS
jgi:hypothetical protein